MPYYFQRISNGVCGFSAPRFVWGSPTQSKLTANRKEGGKRSHIGADFQIWIKSSPLTEKSPTDYIRRCDKGCANRASKDFINVTVRAIGQGQ